MYTHAQPPTVSLGNGRVGGDGVAAVYASSGKGVVFADDFIRALLTVRHKVAVGEVDAGQTLVTGDPSAFVNRQREVRQPTHVDLVESQPRDGADRIVARKFDVRELFIPVVLEFVDDHCQHLGHRVVCTFYPTVAVWVVRAGGNFPNPEKLINGVNNVSHMFQSDVIRMPSITAVVVSFLPLRTITGDHS